MSMRVSAVALLVVILIGAWLGGCQAATAQLTMTLPAYEAASDSLGHAVCRTSKNPLHDLSRLELWGAPQAQAVRMVASYDVRGMEGQPVAVFMEDHGWVWTLWVKTRNLANNPSCESNHIGLNLGPGIPDPARPADHE